MKMAAYLIGAATNVSSKYGAIHRARPCIVMTMEAEYYSHRGILPYVLRQLLTTP